MKNLKKDIRSNIIASATSKYVRISPIKVRSILNQLKGRPAQEAYFILDFIPNKSSQIISNVLKSALANADKKYGKSFGQSFISKAVADEVTPLKRFQPRSQGRAFPISKPFSNILIWV